MNYRESQRPIEPEERGPKYPMLLDSILIGVLIITYTVIGIVLLQWLPLALVGTLLSVYFFFFFSQV